MRLYILGIVLLGIFSLTGCASTITAQQAQSVKDLSPEQIDALNRSGQAVVACLTIGGPPPLGAGTILITPKTAAGSVEFGPDCHPKTTVILNNGK